MKTRILPLIFLAATPLAVVPSAPLVDSVHIVRVDAKRIEHEVNQLETQIKRARLVRRGLITGAIALPVCIAGGTWLRSGNDDAKVQNAPEPEPVSINQVFLAQMPTRASWSTAAKNALMYGIIFTGATAIVSRLFSGYNALERWTVDNAKALFRNNAVFHYHRATNELIAEAQALANHLACLEGIATPPEATHLQPNRPAYTSFSLSLVVQHNRFVKALEHFLAAVRVLQTEHSQPFMKVDPKLCLAAVDAFSQTLEDALHVDADRSQDHLLSAWCQVHDAIHLLVDVWNHELGDA